MEEKEWEAKQLNKRIRALDSSYRLVLIPQGLGDILYFCSYLKEYRRMYAGKKLALIATKKHFVNLLMLYKEFWEELLYIDTNLFDRVDNSRFIYYEPWIYNPDKPQDHLVHAVRQGMGVEINATPYYPTIYISQYEKKRIERLIIKSGKAVLISPEAVSCSINITKSEWIYLADLLERKGLQIYFNCGSDVKYGKYPNLFLSLRETLIFTHYAGYFIGIRSGLCDVVAALSDCKQIFIYPNNKKRGEFPSIRNYDKNPNFQYMEYCSLKKAFPDRIITEFIYEKGLFHMIEREFESGKDIS